MSTTNSGNRSGVIAIAIITFALGVVLGLSMNSRTFSPAPPSMTAQPLTLEPSRRPVEISLDPLPTTASSGGGGGGDGALPARRQPQGASIRKVAAAIAAKHGRLAVSDKFRDEPGAHDYGYIYEKVLAPYVAATHERFKLLEIGLGCAGTAGGAGAGYRFFTAYAPNVQYAGIDLVACDFAHLGPEAVAYLKDHTYRGSQTDKAVLDRAHAEQGPFDVIVDDGSHRSEHIMATFNHMFPKLRPGGVYIIEDLFACFSSSPYVGGYRDRRMQRERKTAIQFLTAMIMQLSFPFEQPRSGALFVHPSVSFPITALARMIRSIECDREVCAITKMDGSGLHPWPVPCAPDFFSNESTMATVDPWCAMPSKYVRP